MPFAMRKASFGWNYWIWIKDFNSIINDCKTIRACVLQSLTKWQYKHFNAAICLSPSIQNQKLYTLIASENMSDITAYL